MIMKQCVLIIITVLLLGSFQVQAKDFNASNFLAKKCSACHGSEVYSRPDHRMQNLRQLEAQVRRCDANVGTGLFNEDIDVLVKHLNESYYRF